MDIKEIDRAVLKSTIREILMEDTTLLKSVLKEILIENKIIKNERQTEIERLINEEFEKYDEVFKALA
jgi:hypothetical protein